MPVQHFSWHYNCVNLQSDCNELTKCIILTKATSLFSKWWSIRRAKLKDVWIKNNWNPEIFNARKKCLRFNRPIIIFNSIPRCKDIRKWMDIFSLLALPALLEFKYLLLVSTRGCFFYYALYNFELSADILQSDAIINWVKSNKGRRN